MADHLPSYLIRRGRRWSYRRRVPGHLTHLLGSEVLIALRTDSREVATRRAARVNEATEAYWRELEVGGGAEELAERYGRAVAVARRLGWSYRPLAELATDAPLPEVLARIEAASGAPKAVQAAILGEVDEPGLRLSSLLSEWERLTPEAWRGKNEDQIRIARRPKERAVERLIAVIGDRPLSEVTASDALAFRDWLADRLGVGLAVASANKDITSLSALWTTVVRHHRLGLANPFAGLSFRGSGRAGPGKHRGESVPTPWILDMLARLDGLNDEARDIVAILVETGARPSEICGLEAGDIVMDHPVPHIRIRPNATRAIKTDASVRDLPLVGLALPAMQRIVARGGIRRYAGRAASYTTAVGKYLREHGITSGAQSLYSLRHAFQDRCIAAEITDRVVADLMGHNVHRPRYGAGPTLAQKRDTLLRVAIGGAAPP